MGDRVAESEESQHKVRSQCLGLAYDTYMLSRYYSSVASDNKALMKPWYSTS